MMIDHQSRSRNNRAASPTPSEIRSVREAVGLTQTEAATLIHGTMRAWQQYEAGERMMHAGLWELFTTKTAKR